MNWVTEVKTGRSQTLTVSLETEVLWHLSSAPNQKRLIGMQRVCLFTAAS